MLQFLDVAYRLEEYKRTTDVPMLPYDIEKWLKESLVISEDSVKLAYNQIEVSRKIMLTLKSWIHREFDIFIFCKNVLITFYPYYHVTTLNDLI